MEHDLPMKQITAQHTHNAAQKSTTTTFPLSLEQLGSKIG
jgi:hypothetical protein